SPAANAVSICTVHAEGEGVANGVSCYSECPEAHISMADKKGSNSEKLLYCSFCGKSQHEVKKLIAGPSVFICDECIDLCNEIIRDEAAGAGIEAGLSKSDLPTPQEIREILDQYV